MDTLSHVRSFFERYPKLDDEKTRQIVLEVNQLMDVFGAGPEGHLHCWRKFLHHREGLDYFHVSRGLIGRMAAACHVRDDCGSIHSVLDYYNGTLDENGMVR